MIGGRKPAGWTALFLATTLSASVSGFLFPVSHFTPALGAGAGSLLLAAALVALHGKHLTGAWRWIYAVTAVTALSLDVPVLIVQAFLKMPQLQSLAPNGNEPPFLIAQTAALLLFVALGIAAIIRFRPASMRPI
ncbi:MAG TPA: hypothetical protein VE224_15395 [Pseudolabrys sp.]|nr:hypothetical protein [Pseudolabrys sp.]